MSDWNFKYWISASFRCKISFIICYFYSYIFAYKFKINISGEYARFIDPLDNIFTNIIKYFQQEFNIKDNVEIDLAKNIPVGSGLGGGSSNGAKLIEYFNKKYNYQRSKSGSISPRITRNESWECWNHQPVGRG